MENMQQVSQQDLRLGRHTFVKRLLPHVTIDDAFLPERTEIGITRVLLLQGLITVCIGITVHDTPVIGIVSLVVYRFKIERDTTGTVVVLQEIIGTGIA